MSSPLRLAYRGEAALALAPANALPPAPRRLRIGMPQLDLGGLSENWLLRAAGDLHWEQIAQRLGVTTDSIRAEADERLYPTVVALRARYEAPLSAVVENDVLDFTAEVEPCGGACAHGVVTAEVKGVRYSVELLTTFALRQGPGGAMQMALPAARLANRWRPMAAEPELTRRARAARKGEPIEDDFWGPAPRPGAAAIGRTSYEPSPYTEYNGARLLYFASYVSIADTAERRLVHQLDLDRAVGEDPDRDPDRDPDPGRNSDRDWALATSPTARDVFFYGNLPLGASLSAELRAFEARAPRADGGPATGTVDAADVRTRMRLTREPGGEPMADLLTRRVMARRRRNRKETPATRGALKPPRGLP